MFNSSTGSSYAEASRKHFSAAPQSSSYVAKVNTTKKIQIKENRLTKIS